MHLLKALRDVLPIDYLPERRDPVAFDILAAALVAGCSNEPKIGGVEIKKISDTWAKEALEHIRLAAEDKIEFNPEEANRRVVIISALGGIALAQALA